MIPKSRRTTISSSGGGAGAPPPPPPAPRGRGPPTPGPRGRFDLGRTPGGAPAPRGPPPGGGAPGVADKHRSLLRLGPRDGLHGGPGRGRVGAQAHLGRHLGPASPARGRGLIARVPALPQHQRVGPLRAPPPPASAEPEVAP